MMKQKKGMGGHQSATAITHDWLTPPQIIKALGEFDLDPCYPVNAPWPTAKKHYTILDDGLSLPWIGRVWMNPPYGNHITPWLKKMSEHGHGIVLTFNRSDRADFHKYVFPFADSMFMFYGRLFFHRIDGTRAEHNGGAPNVLFSFGEQNSQAIADSGLRGAHVPVNKIPVIIVGISPSWKTVIKMSINRLGGEAEVKDIYDMVEAMAGDKVQGNSNWKEKVRQQLQLCFVKIKRGYYKSTEVN